MTGITLYPYVNIENIFIDRKQNLYQWVSSTNPQVKLIPWNIGLLDLNYEI